MLTTVTFLNASLPFEDVVSAPPFLGESTDETLAHRLLVG